MSTELRFTIHFHGPFSVATGTAGGGIDQRVDRARPIPSSSLKGVMRAEAEHRLGVQSALVAEIFGDQQQRPACWRWTDAQLDGATVGLWSRVKLDPSGRSDERALMFGEQWWANTAAFTVIPLRTLSADEDTRHRLVLRAAARHVASFGKHRRRGVGWVNITDDQTWSDAESATLMALTSEVTT